MRRMRVYEYAKQNKTTSKEVIEHLQELNISISNHMSTISTETKAKLDEKFKINTQPESAKAKKEEENESEKENTAQITYSGALTVSELAERLEVNTNEIIKKLMVLGFMATKNQDLDDDTIELIAS